MRDLVTGDRPNCERLHGGDRGGPAVQRRELHFERLPIRVDMHHRADVTHFEALSSYGLCQDDAIMLLDHFEGSLLARIRGHESRRICATVDDPNRPDGPSAALFVEKIVDHLATIDDSKVSVAKLHIVRIVTRRVTRPTLR